MRVIEREKGPDKAAAEEAGEQVHYLILRWEPKDQAKEPVVAVFWQSPGHGAGVKLAWDLEVGERHCDQEQILGEISLVLAKYGIVMGDNQ